MPGRRRPKSPTQRSHGRRTDFSIEIARLNPHYRCDLWRHGCYSSPQQQSVSDLHLRRKRRISEKLDGVSLRSRRSDGGMVADPRAKRRRISWKRRCVKKSPDSGLFKNELIGLLRAQRVPAIRLVGGEERVSENVVYPRSHRRVLGAICLSAYRMPLHLAMSVAHQSHRSSHLRPRSIGGCGDIGRRPCQTTQRIAAIPGMILNSRYYFRVRGLHQQSSDTGHKGRSVAHHTPRDRPWPQYSRITGVVQRVFERLRSVREQICGRPDHSVLHSVDHFGVAVVDDDTDSASAAIPSSRRGNTM